MAKYRTAVKKFEAVRRESVEEVHEMEKAPDVYGPLRMAGAKGRREAVGDTGRNLQSFKDAGLSERDMGAITAAGTQAMYQHTLAVEKYAKITSKATKATADAANVTNTMQQKMYNYGKAVTAVNLALGGAAAIIREVTLARGEAIMESRGELSGALGQRMSVARGAGILKAIPFVGGAMGGVVESMHGVQQQAYGTEFMARAAAVFESSIPKIDAALDGLAVSIKSSAIGIKYAFAPAEGAYQQKLLGINAGPAGTALQTLQGQRGVAEAKYTKQQVEYNKLQSRLGHRPVPGGSYREDVAIEKLAQAKGLAEQYRTPGIRAAEITLREGLAMKRAQAGQEYMLDYYKGFSPTSGAVGSFGQAGTPGGLPAVDRTMTEVELTAAIKALTQALEGINPTGRTGA